MAPSLLMNLYITGLNQLTDVEIDRINKPYLPLASGELSIAHGWQVVLVSLGLALVFAAKAAWPLRGVLLGSAALGTVYSLPPFRCDLYLLACWTAS
jgi:homogentisate phytyltransferase/homogentisate geranylgeranyltransferase